VKSIDYLLDRQYDRENYHCVHFVIEAGQYLFGYDFTDNFLGLSKPLDSNGHPSKHTVKNSERVQAPKDGTVVLMTKLDNRLHVGLYYAGRVLHLSKSGVRYQSIRQLEREYKRLRFYNAKNFHQSA
jgi:hypothetical protein